MKRLDPSYILPYVSELIPDRLYVGPFPKSPDAIRFLDKDLLITHIVNLVPTTEKTTSSGLPSDTYYEQFADFQKTTFTFIRHPLMEDLFNQNDKTQVAKFSECARAIFKAIAQSKPDERFYIHSNTGCDEESLVGLLVWVLLGEQPENLTEWMAQKEYHRMLDSEEQKRILDLCVKHVESGASMTRHLCGYKRQKK